jgi:hypothetical protein
VKTKLVGQQFFLQKKNSTKKCFEKNNNSSNKKKKMSAPTETETWIQNGQVMRGPRPVTIMDYLTHAVNLSVFFFTSMVSSEPIRSQVDSFNGSIRARRNGGSSSPFGGGNRTGTSTSTATGKKPNVNTFGPAAQTGCHGGG